MIIKWRITELIYWITCYLCPPTSRRAAPCACSHWPASDESMFLAGGSERAYTRHCLALRCGSSGHGASVTPRARGSARSPLRTTLPAGTPRRIPLHCCSAKRLLPGRAPRGPPTPTGYPCNQHVTYHTHTHGHIYLSTYQQFNVSTFSTVSDMLIMNTASRT